MEKTTIQLKELGLITILKTENSIAKSVAQFDSQTGDRLEDIVTQFFPDQLKKEKESLQIRMDEIDAILAEIDATPITLPENISDPIILNK